MTSQPTAADQRSAEQAAFEYLNNVLSVSWNGPLEIEVLPKPLQDEDEFRIAIDGPCIGVPKRLLALAFCYARMCLFHVRLAQDLDPAQSIAMVLSITQTMLIFDPEHITAANIRKRYLHSLLDERFSARDALDGAIRRELWLLDSLLTSPLIRHSKSPTLWNHRRWLTEEFMEWVLDVQRADVLGTKRMTLLYDSIPDATEILWRSFIEPELHIICKAGVRHPKNYYAWDYARKVMDILSEYALMHEECEDARVVNRTIDFIQGWCLSNLTDTSGWSFLLCLMGRADQSIVTRVFVEVGNLAVTYSHAQEPVWIFVRTLLASEDYLDESFRNTFIGELYGWIEETRLQSDRLGRSADSYGQGKGKQEDSAYLIIVQKHLDWVRHYWQGETRPAVFDLLDRLDLESMGRLSLH